MAGRKLEITVVAMCFAIASRAAAQVVAYSNLGPGDGYDKEGFVFEPLCDDAIISGFGFACLPEQSGPLGTVELALAHEDGANQWLLGLGDVDWPVAGVEKPGNKLAVIDVSDAAIMLTAGEFFFISIRHAAPCCDGPVSRARWHSNSEGAEMVAGVEVVVQACDDGEVSFDPLIGAEPAIRLTLHAGCSADCDGQGALDLFDFLCFFNAFNANDPGADCDHDAAFTLFDFLCFINAFNEGC